jgi:glyoxylase-like metal-dependent hydrolase (beta-lactamase superfamily II)
MENTRSNYQLVSHYHALHLHFFIADVSFNHLMFVHDKIKETRQKQKVVPSINLNFQGKQLILLLAVVTSGTSGILVIFLINSIDVTSQQQYVFAQVNSSPPTNNKTNTDTTFPQIHNYTSSPPGPVNSWIVESANGVVIIDTQQLLSEAKNLLREVNKIDKPILGIIITHPHPDHIGGTAVLLKGIANVPIYSTQSVYNIMKTDTGGKIELAKKFHGNDYADQIVLPNRIVNSGENVTIDGITWNFEDLGPGEAGDMTLIYLPSQKILFTGDVVNNRMIPFLAEGRTSDWIKQIEYIKQNYSDAKVLFPGHGESGSPATLLDLQLNYINTFRSLIEQQIKSAIGVGGEKAGNITEDGKTKIKSDLQSLYPNYMPVANLPAMLDLNDLNIDAVAKEISQEK